MVLIFLLFVNLIEKEIEFNSNKISRTKKFSFDRNQSYFFQIKSFLTNRFNLCTYDEALFLIKKNWWNPKNLNEYIMYNLCEIWIQRIEKQKCQND